MKSNRTALLVIDIQNDFCLQNSSYNKLGYPVKQNIKLANKVDKLINRFKDKKVKIYYILSNYDNYIINNKKCGFCFKNSDGAESFLSKTRADRIIKKTTHDGFYKTKLDYFLKKDNIKTILLTGISTSVCVDSTARSAVYRGFNTIIIRDGVTSRDKNLHNFSLNNFKVNFGDVQTSKNILMKIK